LLQNEQTPYLSEFLIITNIFYHCRINNFYCTIKLKEYNIEAITGGTDALGQVKVKLEDERGELINARAVDPDIVNASIKAMINGMNRYLAKRRFENSE
jgi:hypothetical protein